MINNSLIYVVSSIISSIIPFLLLPVLTRYLSPEEYGQIAMFVVFTSALSSIVGLSSHAAANRRYFDVNLEKHDLNRFYFNCLFVNLTTAIVTLILVFLLGNKLQTLLGISFLWLLLGVIYVLFNSFLIFRLCLWQVRGNAIIYGVTQLSNSLILVIVTLVLVVVFSYGADGRVYALVAVSVCIGLLSLVTMYRESMILTKFSKIDLLYIVNYGLPLVPHVFGGFLLVSIDRLIIKDELGLHSAGVYMTAYTISGALNMVFLSINKAYSPWLFSKLAIGCVTTKKMIVKYTYIYLFFLLIFMTLGAFFSPYVYQITMGREFQEGAQVLPYLIIGQVFFGAYLMITNYIYYVKKTKVLAFVTFLCGALNISMMLYLIPHNGLLGVAVSFMLASVVRFVLTWLISARLYSMPWFGDK